MEFVLRAPPTVEQSSENPAPSPDIFRMLNSDIGASFLGGGGLVKMMSTSLF